MKRKKEVIQGLNGLKIDGVILDEMESPRFNYAEVERLLADRVAKAVANSKRDEAKKTYSKLKDSFK